MTGNSRRSGTFSQNPPSDTRAGIDAYSPEQDGGGEYDAKQYAGHGGRTDE